MDVDKDTDMDINIDPDIDIDMDMNIDMDIEMDMEKDIDMDIYIDMDTCIDMDRDIERYPSSSGGSTGGMTLSKSTALTLCGLIAEVDVTCLSAGDASAERDFFIDNLLVRIHSIM